MSEFDHQDLKMALGNFATGVTIVTTRSNGSDIGMTCNSFASVSLEPAMVLWSIRKASISHEIYVNGSGYTVNVLSADQELLALDFSRGVPEERFANAATERLDSGRLKIVGCASWFDCALEQVVSAGDHDILIGRVLDFGSTRCDVLGYAHSEFKALSAAQTRPSVAAC